MVIVICEGAPPSILLFFSMRIIFTCLPEPINESDLIIIVSGALDPSIFFSMRIIFTCLAGPATTAGGTGGTGGVTIAGGTTGATGATGATKASDLITVFCCAKEIPTQAITIKMLELIFFILFIIFYLIHFYNTQI